MVQKGEGRAIPYHHPFLDCPLKQLPRGHPFRQQPHQHKIPAGGIHLKPPIPCKQLVHPCPFPGNQFPGFLDIGFVTEHDFPGNHSQGIDGPGVFPGVDGFHKLPVPGNGIAQPEPRRCKELGSPPQDDDIVVVGRQRHRSNRFIVVRKFHISFIYHYENIILLAHVKDMAHGAPCDGAGGRVVGVAED